MSFIPCLCSKALLIEICFCQHSQGGACRQHLQTSTTPGFCLEMSLTCLCDVSSPQLLGMGKDPALLCCSSLEPSLSLKSSFLQTHHRFWCLGVNKGCGTEP